MKVLQWIIAILGLFVVCESIHVNDLYHVINDIWFMFLACWNAFESYDIDEDYLIALWSSK